jgi:protein-S-isoprenylcysteine O-methyltransferase Ste14
VTTSADDAWRLPVIALLWLIYFGLHSALASLAVKRWFLRRWPDLMPGYRIGFNVLALVLLLPVAALVYGDEGAWLWRWSGATGAVAAALRLAALAGFFWSLRGYDSAEFFGTRQWRNRRHAIEDGESLHISTLHRYVRHPWYFLGLILVWTADMNPALLLSAVLVSAYFFVGSRLEEAKLLRYHGAAYARYMGCVGGLIPLPWKFLSPQAAAEIEALAAAGRPPQCAAND